MPSGCFRPAGGDDLLACVEANAVWSVHVGVAKLRLLPTTEEYNRSNGDGVRNVDAHHAGLHVDLELTSEAAVSGEDRRTISIDVGVHELDRRGRSRPLARRTGQAQIFLLSR